MENLLANLAGKTRRETLNGREHIVAPLSLIVPGVLNGSQGPLYYPPEEVSKSPEDWNGVPIVVNHPMADGIAISARSPDVLNTSSIGTVFHARVDGKLLAEGWFDVEKTAEVDSRVLNALLDGDSIEISTGLFTDNEEAPEGSSYLGKPYTHIARNYKPDHLAILPEGKGACSIADGCGVLNEDGKPTTNKISHEEVRDKLQTLVRGRHSGNDLVWIEAVFTSYFVYSVGETLYTLGYSVDMRSNDRVTISSEPSVEVKRVVQYKPVTNNKGGENQMSEKKKKDMVDKLIANACCWEEKDREFLSGLEDDKLKKLVEQGEKEKRYELIANAVTKGFKFDESINPSNVIRVVFNAETNEWDVEQRKDAKPEDEPETTTNNEEETVKPKTTQEWMQDAPPEIQSAVRNAMNLEAQHKARIIERLTANLDNEAKSVVVQQLNTNTLEELQVLESLAPKQPEGIQEHPRYVGASTPTGNRQTPEIDKDDILPLPAMSWED